MKKIIFILVLLLLCGCGSENKQPEEIIEDKISIITPSGAPALAFYNFLNEDFEVNEAGVIKTLVLSENAPDIAVLPTNVAIALISKGANYSLAATLTFGNFYIVSKGIDDNETMDTDDKIVLFQEGGVPDQVFRMIYNFDDFNNISYVNEASDASREIVNQNSDVEYVMIAEPAMYVSLNKNNKAFVYEDLQASYEEKYGHQIYQASLLINNNLDVDKANAFLAKLENDIKALLDEPYLFVKAYEKINMDEMQAQALFGNINANVECLKNNTLNLGFEKAYDNKDAIDIFLKNMGMNVTNEEIYFK